jgi:arabinogalactan oligomer/maltooligosaccharide transport system permease protein
MTGETTNDVHPGKDSPSKPGILPREGKHLPSNAPIRASHIPYKRPWHARISIAWVFVTPALAITMLLVVYPLVQGITFSFTDMNQFNMGSIFAEPSWKFIGLDNYAKALFAPDTSFYRVLLQSITFTLSSVVAHILIGMGLAVLLNQKLKGRLLFRTMLLVPWAVPSFVSAFGWRWLFNGEYGFFNQLLQAMGMNSITWLSDPFWAMFAVILTNIWLGFPFMMITFLGGLQSIPSSLYEAATMDGASRFKQFTKITLPMLKPVTFAATLLGIIWTFNLFHVIYLVTGGGPFGATDILPTYTYFEAFQRWEFGMASTYGVMILSMLLVFSAVYIRMTKPLEN